MVGNTIYYNFLACLSPSNKHVSYNNIGMVGIKKGMVV